MFLEKGVIVWEELESFFLHQINLFNQVADFSGFLLRIPPPLCEIVHIRMKSRDELILS
jgi:hypothetical protein